MTKFLISSLLLPLLLLLATIGTYGTSSTATSSTTTTTTTSLSLSSTKSTASTAAKSTTSIEDFEDTLFSTTILDAEQMLEDGNYELLDYYDDVDEDDNENENENGITLDGTELLKRLGLRGLNENNNQNEQNNNNNHNNQNNKYYNYGNANANNNNGNYNYNYNNGNVNYNNANANNGHNYNYNYANANSNGNSSADWLHDYQLKFQSCHELSQYNSRTGGFSKQTIIKFKVCPSDTCDRRIWFKKCRGGATYAADARDFLTPYMESKMSSEQRTCRYQRSICQYKCQKQNANTGQYYYDSDCVYNCISNGNYNYCLNTNYGNNKVIDMENYMECNQLQKVKNSVTGYPYYGQVHCGLAGQGIYFSLYEDQYCSRRADTTLSSYDFRNQYGVALPYFDKSLVHRNECVSCRERSSGNNNDHNNYYDHKDDNDVAHSCSQLYNKSLKCENRRFFRRLLSSGTPNTDGCKFINRSLYAMDDVNRGGRRRIWMNILMWILGLAVCYLCVISCMMGKRNSKSRRLADQDYHNSEENFSKKEKERQREWEKEQQQQQRGRSSSRDDDRSVMTSDTKRSKSPFKYFKKNKNGKDDHSMASGVFS